MRFSPGTKVIIITGRPESEIRTLALTGGAFGFWAKPIDDEAFLSCVRQALGK
jgi:DNA-binding NtrC family response regulator